MEKPNKNHWNRIKRVFKYLKEIVVYVLVWLSIKKWSKNSILIIYDFGWTDDINTEKILDEFII